MDRRYPHLKPRDVVNILKNLGFSFKRQNGSHAHWERPADDKGRLRALVMIDMSMREFCKDLIKSMIRQSGHSKKEFYEALS